MDALRLVFAVTWAAIEIVVGNALDILKTIVNVALSLLNGDVEGALVALRDMFISIWTRIYETVRDLIEDIVEIIDDRLKASGTSIEEITNSIRNRFTAWVTGIRDDMIILWNRVKATIVDAVNTFWSGVEFALNSVRNGFTAWVTGIRDDMSTWWANVKATIVDAVEAFYSPIENAWSNIRIMTERIVGEIGGSVKGIWDGVINDIKAGLNAIINFYNSNVASVIGSPAISLLQRAGTSSRGSALSGESASRNTTFNLTANYGNQDERSLRDDVQMLQMLYGGV
jgi:phage-related protein